MLITPSLVSALLTFLSINLNDCNNVASNKKVVIVGIAVIVKNDPAVKADDGNVYFLDRLYEWEDKILDKRVEVTGKLVTKVYKPEKVDPDDPISITSQQKIGTWRIIRKPKWKLVE